MFPIDQEVEDSTGFSPGTIHNTYRNPAGHRSSEFASLAKYSPTNSFAYKFTKRVFDITFAILLLPVIALVGLVIALFIYVESPGVVLFSHRRIQCGGKSFRMWKFRTMCHDAPQVLKQYLEQHPESRMEWRLTHKLKSDPRVTSVGAFLRRSSLDELPQIWNIFNGTMSFVGPRPIVKEEIQKYGQDYIYYTAVKPGLSGLWQTSGRSTLSYEQRVALDRFYVENWSLWLELGILLRTIRTVIKSDGAY